VDKLQFDRIMGYIDQGKSSGLNLAAGGARKFDTGYFVEPTIFVDMPDSSKLFSEEIFGPVMGIAKFSDEADVVRRANASRYGLAAGVFTSNINTANRVATHSCRHRVDQLLQCLRQRNPIRRVQGVRRGTGEGTGGTEELP